MTRYLCTALALTAGLLLTGGTASAQAPATKLISPVRGEAELGYLKPVTKREGNMIVTTIKVKNLAAGPIAGLKVDEFNHIVETMTADASVRERVAAKLQERQGGGGSP